MAGLATYDKHGKLIQNYLLMYGETPTAEAIMRVCKVGRNKAHAMMHKKEAWSMREVDLFIDTLHLNANDIIEIFFPDKTAEIEKSKTDALMRILSSNEKMSLLRDIILDTLGDNKLNTLSGHR